MITAILAFFCGVLVLQYVPVLPGFMQIVAACLLGIFAVAGWFCIDKKFKKTRYCLMLFVLFLLGFLYALLLAKLEGQWELPQELLSKNITVTGYVSSLPVNKIAYTKFRFTTEYIDGTKQKTNLLLGYYGKDRLPISAGEKWQLLVRLKRPHGMLNPGGFDYEKYLWQQHIRATGYVESSVENKKINSAHLPLRYLILVLRQELENKIAQVLDTRPLLGMISALVLGDQSWITSAQWKIFQNTGTSYLMAIAGLHICLAAGVVFIFVQFLWCRCQRFTLWIPAKKAAALFGFLAAIVYSALSGFSIPTQRALIMLLVFTGALLLQRNVAVWHVLFIALFMVLLLDPMSVLTIGFWLSFFSMTLIFYVTSGRLLLSGAHWRKYTRMQGAITLGLAPFTILFFSQASIITFAANIFALPGVCLLVVPLSLFGSLSLLLFENFGKYILLLAEKLMELVWYGLQWLSLYPQLNLQHHVFAWWQIALAIVGVFLILAPRGVFGKLAGIIWLCPLLFCVPPKPGYGEIWFNVLDVGQGLATVVQTQHHVLLYDTGPKFADSDVGESVVVPFLQTEGITNIDTIVVSHGDSDHSGGANSILQLMPVAKVVSSIPKMFPKASVTQNCYAGQEWQWDGVNFHIIYPPQNMEYDGNKSSCVLRVDNGHNSILLTGDIEHGQEKFLLQHAAGLLSSSILVAPHHGSTTSSTPDFIRAVHPEYVLFAVGEANRFHFPAAEVLERYQQQGAKILQTNNSGAIEFKLTAEQNILPPLLYRELTRHYWYDY